MSRNVFYSFHYKPDNWRASQIRNIGVVEGNKPAHDNDWESIKKGGDTSIKKWIDNQLVGRSCTIVLIGEKTAGRKWINYEIEKTWSNGKGLVAIHIHNIKDSNGNQSSKGGNPFKFFTVGDDKKNLSKIVKAYDPPYSSSSYAYNYIKDNLEEWVEEAIKIRKKN